MLNEVSLFYNTLRAGINLKDKNGNTLFYFKSNMKLYADSRLETWDKKAIKEQFFGSGAPANARDYKDILGFSAQENWRNTKNPILNIKIEKKIVGIDRIPSPILFKPVYQKNDWYIYIIAKQTSPLVFNKGVQISEGGGRRVTLNTVGSFDVSDYLAFVFDGSSVIRTHIEAAFHKHDYFSKISAMYSQISLKKTL